MREREMKQMLRNVLKGELGMRIGVWRHLWKREVDVEHVKALTVLERVRVEGEIRVALQLMKQVLRRLVRDQLGLSVEIWRQHYTKYLLAKHGMMLQAVKKHTTSTAFRMVKECVLRIAKHGITQKLQAWREVANSHARRNIQAQHAMHMKDLELKRVTAESHFGFKMLRRIMTGDLSTCTCIEIWRHACRTDQRDKYEEGTKQLEADLESLKEKFLRNAAAVEVEKHSLKCRGAFNSIKQAMWYLTKGELGMRVRIWRNLIARSINAAQVSCLDVMKTQLTNSHYKNAIRITRHVMLRLVKGEMSKMVDIWRMHVCDERQAQRILWLETQMQEEASDSRRRTGIRMIRQIMRRMVCGEFGLRIHLWRKQHMRSLKIENEETLSNLEATWVNRQAIRGIHGLTQTLLRLMRGEISFRLHLWSKSMKVHTVRRSLESKRMWAQQKIGLRLLGESMARLMKGESWLRIYVWKGAMQKEEAKEEAKDLLGSHIRAMRLVEAKRLEAEAKSGVKMLIQNIRRLIKGELAFRIQIWKQLCREYSLMTHQGVVKELQVALRSTVGVQMMKRMLNLLMKEEKALYIYLWRRRQQQDDLNITSAHINELEQNFAAAEEEAMKRYETLKAKRLEEKASTALNLMEHALRRILYGQVGIRIKIWRQSSETSKHEQFKNEAGNHLKEQTGLNLMRKAVMRLSKHNTCMRLDIWRRAVKNHKRTLHVELDKEIERKRINAEARFGLHFVKQVMMRLVEDKMKIRVGIWQESVRKDAKLAVRAQHAVVMKDMDATRLAEKSKMGLQLMKRVTWRLLKVEVGMRVEIWQTMLRKASIEEKTEAIKFKFKIEFKSIEEKTEALTTQHLAAKSNVGVRLVKQVMKRFVKGEMTRHISNWHIMMKEGQHVEGMLSLKSEFKAEVENANRGKGLLQFRQIMIRLLKREVMMKIEAWKHLCKESLVKKEAYMRMVEALEAKRSASEAETGLRMMKQVMVRLVKGEIGLRVDIWRQLWWQSRDTDHMTAIQTLEQEHNAAEVRVGVRLVKQAVTRLRRGEMRLRIDIWREAHKHALSLDLNRKSRLRRLIFYVTHMHLRQCLTNWTLNQGDYVQLEHLSRIVVQAKSFMQAVVGSRLCAMLHELIMNQVRCSLYVWCRKVSSFKGSEARGIVMRDHKDHRIEMENLKGEHRATENKLRAVHQALLADAKAAQLHALKTHKAAHDQEMEDLRILHTSAMNQLRDGMEAEMLDTREEMHTIFSVLEAEKNQLYQEVLGLKESLSRKGFESREASIRLTRRIISLIDGIRILNLLGNWRFSMRWGLVEKQLEERWEMVEQHADDRLTWRRGSAVEYIERVLRDLLNELPMRVAIWRMSVKDEKAGRIDVLYGILDEVHSKMIKASIRMCLVYGTHQNQMKTCRALFNWKLQQALENSTPTRSGSSPPGLPGTGPRGYEGIPHREEKKPIMSPVELVAPSPVQLIVEAPLSPENRKDFGQIFKSRSFSKLRGVTLNQIQSKAVMEQATMVYEIRSGAKAFALWLEVRDMILLKECATTEATYSYERRHMISFFLALQLQLSKSRERRRDLRLHHLIMAFYKWQQVGPKKKMLSLSHLRIEKYHVIKMKSTYTGAWRLVLLDIAYRKRLMKKAKRAHKKRETRIAFRRWFVSTEHRNKHRLSQPKKFTNFLKKRTPVTPFQAPKKNLSPDNISLSLTKSSRKHHGNNSSPSKEHSSKAWSRNVTPRLSPHLSPSISPLSTHSISPIVSDPRVVVPLSGRKLLEDSYSHWEQLSFHLKLAERTRVQATNRMRLYHLSKYFTLWSREAHMSTYEIQAQEKAIYWREATTRKMAVVVALLRQELAPAMAAARSRIDAEL